MEIIVIGLHGEDFRLAETGVYATAHEIAVAEKINRSYISRLLRLTLLAPDIVEAVLDGRAPTIIAVDISLKSLPDEWDAQRRMLAICNYVGAA
ncbi:hypothetical protein [Mesorhizobium sp. CN2-181]|uniref:hypothetical protein n=1 Tax=Mesorhizobium yinganensis TaxID=3157707 RepID=UPI0032B839E7